ncbi:hypothetical protein CYMTET_53976 [Cymbomonas tetramitiformis]|uniref:PurM-like C-terminal domain-containing protein n=1 Tax=Cymbomonas tetramitiformis TaxID=36881 RepID=A0AAE0ER76_9CHLO|nr:hypothetical protein CYMTET_53976 [Cymbomonas tetramitiformis]
MSAGAAFRVLPGGRGIWWASCLKSMAQSNGDAARHRAARCAECAVAEYYLRKPWCALPVAYWRESPPFCLIADLAVLAAHGATACTDVTGFGFLGHLVEMCKASLKHCTVHMGALPLLPGALECVQNGIFSSLQPANVRLKRGIANEADAMQHAAYPLLFDPQTAGGLLASVPADQADACCAALRAVGYNNTRILQDGKVLTRPPKTYTREEFCYRLLAFARSMPDSVDREIHFYHMYVIDLFTKLDLYDVKSCVAEYDKYIRQRLATNFITSWNPDMLVGTWKRFIQSRKEAGNSVVKTPRSKASDAATPTPRTPKPGLHCFQWNAGKCSKKGCKFPHTCSSCGGDHKKTEWLDMDIDAEREASRTDSNEENVYPGGGETTTLGSLAPVEPGHRLMTHAE